MDRRRDDLAEMLLLFDAVKEQCKLLDQECEDPALTPYILAIDALAQAGFCKCWRLHESDGRAAND